MVTCSGRIIPNFFTSCQGVACIGGILEYKCARQFQYLVCRPELFRLTQSVCVTYDIASHAGILRGSSRVPAPRRTSAWEATYDIAIAFTRSLFDCLFFPFVGDLGKDDRIAIGVSLGLAAFILLFLGFFLCRALKAYTTDTKVRI